MRMMLVQLDNGLYVIVMRWVINGVTRLAYLSQHGFVFDKGQAMAWTEEAQAKADYLKLAEGMAKMQAEWKQQWGRYEG